MADYAGSEQKFIDVPPISTVGGYQTDFAPSAGSVYTLGDSGGTAPVETIRDEPMLPRREP
jgi:hypothetical protein